MSTVEKIENHALSAARILMIIGLVLMFADAMVNPQVVQAGCVQSSYYTEGGDPEDIDCSGVKGLDVLDCISKKVISIFKKITSTWLFFVFSAGSIVLSFVVSKSTLAAQLGNAIGAQHLVAQQYMGLAMGALTFVITMSSFIIVSAIIGLAQDFVPDTLEIPMPDIPSS